MISENKLYEYRIVTAVALRKRDGAGEQEKLLNELADDRWELIDARRSDIWDWTWDSTETLVLRRARDERPGHGR